MKKKLLLLTFIIGVVGLANSQIIDIIGKGVIGKTNENIPLTNIENIDHVYVSAFHKDGNNSLEEALATDVKFKANGTTQSTWHSQTTLGDNLTIKYRPNKNTASIGYFDATFNTFDSGGVDIAIVPNETEHIYSFYGYIYRTVPGATHKSFINTKNLSLYQNGRNDPFVYNIPIDTAPSPRDITVKIPMSELDPPSSNPNRTRELKIDITVGSEKREVTIKEYNPNGAGDSFFLGEYTFTNVPGGVNNVEVSVYSPRPEGAENSFPNNGQSVFISGVVVDVAIDCSGFTVDAGEDQIVYLYNPPTADECATLTATATGGTDYTYLWSTGETTSTIEVCPTETTTYTVTVTSANGCVTADEIVVIVIDCTDIMVDAGEDQTVYIYEPPTAESCATLTAVGTGDTSLTYAWSTEETTSTIEVCPTQTTTYTVTVTAENGCIAKDTVTVHVIDAKGAYCCDDINLVVNGNFEFGNTEFTSAYTNTTTTYPGEYDITNTADAFGATVTDHSFCADPIEYVSNDLFMVVNGKTQQTDKAIIWEQTLTGLVEGQGYKFCANFKNMPQCRFDILPVIYMEVGTTSSEAQTINTISTDPCDWQNVTLDFIAEGTTQSIRILLDESGNGDGNDVAIDDIFVGSTDPNLQITVQHDGSTSEIVGSLNSITTTDDTLHGKCNEYHWFIAESTSFPEINIDWSTFAHGNNTGSLLPPSVSTPGPEWDLTTNFPGYSFIDNKLYIIGMYSPECGCYDEGFTYQLTFNAKSSGGLTEAQKEEIIDVILNGLDREVTTPGQSQLSQKLSVHPNPVNDLFKIELQDETIHHIEIISFNGSVLLSEAKNGTKEKEVINMSHLPVGIYYIKIEGANGGVHTTKFIKR